MLEAAGWPNTEGALSRTAAHLGIPQRTLQRWAKGTSNPPPDRIVQRKKIDLAEAIRNELAALFPAMDKTRDEASYKDQAVSVGVLIDKLQLLEGRPTAINENINSDARDRLAQQLDRLTAVREAAEPTQYTN